MEETEKKTARPFQFIFLVSADGTVGANVPNTYISCYSE